MTLLQEWQITLVAMSEADIPVTSRASWTGFWRAHGWHTHLSLPEAGLCRVALLSRVPFKPVNLCEADAAARHAAALVDLETPSGCLSLLCVAAYLQSGQPAVADAQSQDILSAADSCGRPALVFGDFNMTQEQGTVAELLAANVVRACDDAARGAILPPTGPLYQGSRRRRIDYGLTLHGLAATQVLHIPEGEVGTLSDHRLVLYQFDACAPEMLVGPSRRRCRLSTPCPEDFAFPPEDESLFQSLLDTDLDEAWCFASNWAEDLLFEPGDRHCCPRSAEWIPQYPRRRKDFDRDLDQSPALRAMRRLLRKLQLCTIRDWDRPLFQACRRLCVTVRAFVPTLPHLVCGSSEAVTVVADMAAEEKALHLKRWRSRCNSDIHVVRSFIKSRADQQLAWEAQPEDAALTPDGWHRAIAVRTQAEMWIDKWTAKGEPNLQAVAAVLSDIPRPQPVSLDFTLTGDDLRRATQAMQRKTGGPDDWQPTDLIHLPRSWFSWMARLWMAILRSGKVPIGWKQARVALLWKSRQRTRPISLLNAIWRAGTRVLQARLAPWIETWADFHSAGGLPKTSVQAALQRIRRALDEGATCFVQTDVASFFDSIRMPVLRCALQHLHFPPELLRVLEDFYSGARRVFSLAGAMSPSWATVNCGIAQGCPLSPVLAAALSHIWAAFVTGHTPNPPVEAMAYVDDRTLWVHPRRPLVALRSALERSRVYDRAFGFKLSLDKCAVVPRDPGPEHEQLASDLRFKVQETLEILGVRACFAGAWRLLHCRVRKAVLRANLLGWATRNHKFRRQLFLSLVVPPFAWAAGFARPGAEDVQTLRHAIEDAFKQTFSPTFARVCLFESVGWEVHPEFSCDLGTLRVLWKTCVQAPRWLETVPLNRAAPRWAALIPEAPGLLQKLGWQLNLAGTALSRLDRAGRRRSVYPGRDGFRVLFQWLRQHFRQTQVAKAGRICRSQHREEEGLASGLSLPPPDGTLDFLFDGFHRAMATEVRSVTLAAMGAGHNCWHLNAGGNFEMAHARWNCLCGLARPSRAHLAWTCRCTAQFREGLRPPRDRCEERLLLHGVPEQPPAPSALDPDELFEALVQELCVQMQSAAVIHLATDGSEHCDIGAYALTVQPGGFLCALGNGEEDQSSYKQELLGFALAASAALEAARLAGWSGRIVFVVDCQAVLRVVLRRGEHFSYLLSIINQARQALSSLEASGVQLTYVWVPSHGKRPDWEAPLGLNTDLLRSMNDRADRAAAECRARRSGGHGRAEWWRLREEAASWELRATQATAAAGQALHDCLRRHGLRPREAPLPPAADDGADDG